MNNLDEMNKSEEKIRRINKNIKKPKKRNKMNTCLQTWNMNSTKMRKNKLKKLKN